MTNTKDKWKTPQKTAKIELEKFLPSYAEIPEEFKSGHNKWTKFQSDWYFSGIDNVKLTPKDDVDKTSALAHLGVLQASFEPKYVHKRAGVAYLASLWFDDVSYDLAS